MTKLKFNSTSLLKSLAISFLIFIFFISFSAKSFAATGIYEVVNFQGKVVNKTAGTNVTNGNYDFTFKLFSVSSAGSVIWTENFNTANGNQLTVTDGIFRVALGSVCVFTGGSCQGNTNSAVDFNSDSLYLDITFNGETFATRVRLTAVPYAFNAKQVNGLSVTNNGGNTLNIAANKSLIVSNSLTFAGTDSTTITFQGTDTYVGRTTSDTLTNKTIGSTGLIFSGAATDITTVSNEDFTLTPNGSGNLILTGDFDTQVLIGASGATTEFPLLVRNGIGNNAALAIDNLNSGDILTASSAGTTRFSITSAGGIKLGAAEGSSGECLKSGGAGAAATYGACGSGSQTPWAQDIDADNFSLLDFGTNITARAALTITSTASNTLTFDAGNNIITFAATDTTLSASGLTTITSSSSLAISAATLELGGTGASTIQTNSNDDLTLTPNGTGNLILTGDFDSQVLIGASGATTEFPLLVRNGIGNNAALAIDNLNSGDLITASAGGTTKFTISTTGAIASQAYITDANAVLYTSTTGVVTRVAETETASQCLISGAGASGTPSWSTCPGGSGGSNWTLNTTNGTISPNNGTVDLVLGFGTAAASTASAKFSVTNLAGTLSPIASISATTDSGGNGNGLVFSSNGTSNVATIQSLRNNTLTIGGGTTGDIVLRAGEGIVFIGENEVKNGGLTFYSSGVGIADPTITTDASGNLTISAGQSGASVIVGDGSGNISLSLTAAADGLIADKTVALAAAYSGTDFTFNRILTSDAAGENQNGTVLYVADTSTGLSGTTVGHTLIKGNVDLTTSTFTGNLLDLQVEGATKFMIDASGNVKIGSSSNTPGVLSIDGGVANNAALIIDNNNSGDLLTASSAGTTKFSITNSGGIKLGTAEGSSGNCLKSGGAGAASTWGTCGSAVDGVTITTFTNGGGTTWTKSDYTGLKFTEIIVTASGGGGGGADGDTTSANGGGGGGAGGTAIKMVAEASLGATETVTVGAGGTAGANTGGVGGTGNSSSFGAHASATGGTGGDGSAGGTDQNAAKGGAAGTGSSGDVNLTGGSGTGGVGLNGPFAQGGTGGSSYWGGGGAGAEQNAGGSTAGSNSSAYGAGGGGAAQGDTATGAIGGTGTAGVVVTLNYKSSSGDLAEWYETKEGVEASDIVAISKDSLQYSSRLGLQKVSVLEKAGAGSNVIGVVSTSPYETIGGDILENAKRPRPIALAGRVPVKFTESNGKVKAGDLLTSSSIPGVAMRATKAGVTIGTALEDSDCREGQQCKVLVMVSTSYTTGALLNVAMRDNGISMDEIPGELDYSRIVLAQMIQDKENIVDSQISEIYTDRLAAGLEIITPRVLADEIETNTLWVNNASVSGVLTADIIRANKIEGLEFTVRDQVLSMKDLFGSQSMVSNNDLENSSSEGDLISQVKNLFAGVVEFIGQVIFRNNVEFEGQVAFNKDSAGYAKIQKGQKFVEIVFEKEYLNQPVVNASLAIFNLSDETFKKYIEDGFCTELEGIEVCQDKITDVILNGSIEYALKNQTSKGFVIFLSDQAPLDITFSWQAIAVKDVKTIVGDGPAGLVLPFEGDYLPSNKFGEHSLDPAIKDKDLRLGLRGHDGLDIPLVSGSSVLAVDSGEVEIENNDYGITIYLKHIWGRSVYGHLSERLVKEGDKVTKGQKIALSGNSGLTTGPHLHFGITLNNSKADNGYKGYENPWHYLSFTKLNLKEAVAGVSTSSASLTPTLTPTPSLQPEIQPENSLPEGLVINN